MFASAHCSGKIPSLNDFWNSLLSGTASSFAHSRRMRALSPSGPQAFPTTSCCSRRRTGSSDMAKSDSVLLILHAMSGRCVAAGSENFEANVLLRRLALAMSSATCTPPCLRIDNPLDCLKHLTNDQKRFGLSVEGNNTYFQTENIEYLLNIYKKLFMRQCQHHSQKRK